MSSTFEKEQFVNLGKEIGKKEYIEMNKQKMLEFIDEMMVADFIDETNKYYENMTMTDLENLSYKKNLKDYYKAALYFKNKELKKIEKELDLEKKTNEDLSITCDEFDKELNSLEEKNLKLYNQNTKMKNLINSKDHYIYIIELLCFINFIFFVITDFYNTKFILNYLVLLFGFDYLSFFNIFLIFSFSFYLKNIRAKTKIKYD